MAGLDMDEAGAQRRGEAVQEGTARTAHAVGVLDPEPGGGGCLGIAVHLAEREGEGIGGKLVPAGENLP